MCNPFAGSSFARAEALDQRSTCMTLLASGDPATCPRGANEPSEGLDALGGADISLEAEQKAGCMMGN